MASGVKYRTIVADPPWPYGVGNPRGTQQRKINGQPVKRIASVERYGQMSLDAICSLAPPADRNAHLYLWTTNAFMDAAHDVARAWGFKPKTICTWVKTHQNDPCRVSMKMGHYFHGSTEHWLFAVRGVLSFRPTENAYPTAYLWPRLPHSVKPDAFFDLVETVSPGPYLELFARRQRLGWDTWGNEALEHVSMEEASA